MSTFGTNDGALPGKHAVTVSLAEAPREVTEDDVDAMQEGGAAAMPGYEQMMGGMGNAPEVKQLIPGIYTNPRTSGIEVEVTLDGDNEFTIELVEK